MAMRRHHHCPGGALAPFVEVCWLDEHYQPASAAERILPTGTPELVIDLRGGSLRVADSRQPTNFRSFCGAVVCGPHTESFVIDTARPAALLGCHFRPGGAYPFFALSAEALVNQHLALHELWGSFADDLVARLSVTTTAAAAFRILKQALLTQICYDTMLHPAVAFALRALQSGSHPPDIATITEQLGISGRHFSQLFRRQVGLTPKRFSRVRRFQAVLDQIHTADTIHWADLALACGYCDQAHFGHDFRAFAGLTPSAYRARQTDHRNHLALDR